MQCDRPLELCADVPYPYPKRYWHCLCACAQEAVTDGWFGCNFAKTILDALSKTYS